MIKNNVQANEKIKPNSNEIEKLKLNFPQFFDKDGEFLLDRFKEMLKRHEVNLVKEGYELKFLGKSYARYLSATKTETFLAPHTEENQKDENKNSENLYIIGDNLDALKHLLGSYAGKIKCIYIDPPYNTGSDDFVYPDDFSFTVQELAEMIGIEEEEAERIINLKGKSSHSAWLTFMYPRLILARELLSEDGVIFISIDDNEQANLKLMCDEVFGEENFVAQFIWERAYSPKNDAKYVSCSHDYIYMYTKSINDFKIGRLPRTAEANARYSNPDNDPRGPWKPSDLSAKRYTPSDRYTITTPSGRIVEPPAGRSWRLSEKTFSERLHDNRIWFGVDGNSVPQMKRFLSELKNEGMAPTSLLFYKEVGHSQEGSKEVVSLFDGEGVFDGPKPTRLLQRMLRLANLETNSIVLDFFSGSATTAHAVMQLNAEDGGNRKYILVQLPEQIKENKPAYKAGYRTIDEIGRERIKRAAKKIKEETGADIDYGFKTYSVEQLEEKTLANLLTFEPKMDDLFDKGIAIYDTSHSKGKDSVLATYLALDGYGLSTTTEEYKLDAYRCDKVEQSLYIIEEGLTSSDVAELIRRIENLELDIMRIVVYSDSVQFNISHELKKNLANLRNNKRVELIERY